MKIFCNNCGKVIEPEIPADAHEVTCPLCSGTVQVPESPLSPGAVIGDFLLEKPLSSGGMGVVYLARQISLDRPVALKVLHDKFASNKEYIDGLFREARAAAKLTHPNIVQAYAVGEENGIFYFAMEYIQGKTFKQILKEQNILDFVQAVKVIREICGALQAAWSEQKLVHQDIKPDNIMLASNGFSKLADLGLARSANTDSGPGEDENEVMGTPQYISPEQLTGVPTDVRSDLYSLGATFYQFVTGQFPYPEETAEEMARKHVEGNLTPPIKINPELPIQLSDIIVRMMARNIDERFQTPNDVIAALDAYTEQKKISSMAVPKLKLNLNKKTAAPAAKPGMSTKPTAPAPGKPAAPAPSLSKPAAPAPSLSKPAAPAAPSPSKPAVPATPPSAPAPAPAPAPVPAPAPAPAPAPVPAPAPAPAPAQVPAPVPAPQEKGQGKSEGEISLAPKASKPKAEEKEKGDSENKSADNKQGKNGKNGKKDNKEKGSGSKTAKILLLILLPLLLIALIASLFFTACKGFLGAKMQKFALSAASSIGIKSPDKKSETAQTPQAPEKVSKPVVSVPPPPPAPVTRKEFISEIDRLKGFYRSNPAKNSISFLEGVEKLQQRYLPTVTKEESATYKSLRKIYASVDEGVRAQNYRKAVIEKLQKELDAKVQAAADAKRAAEEKARKLAAQQAAAAARQKEAQKERDARLKKLQNDLDVMYKKLAEAFLTSIRTNNIETLKSVMTEFADFSVPNATNTEYGMLEEFKTFRDQFLPQAFKEFARFQEHLKGVTMSKSIAAGSRMDIEIVRIDPPPQGVYKAVQVNQQKKKLVKIKLNRRLRTDIYDYLNAEAKIKNAAFFYEFMEGKFRTQMTPAMLPSKNWNRFIKVFKRSIPSLRIPNSLLR